MAMRRLTLWARFAIQTGLVENRFRAFGPKIGNQIGPDIGLRITIGKQIGPEIGNQGKITPK